jgi:HSF-type DNA-binding
VVNPPSAQPVLLIKSAGSQNIRAYGSGNEGAMSQKKEDDEAGPEKVQHSYHDHANDEEEESSVQCHLLELSLYRPADQNFTARLHRLLSNADKEGISHIISWQPHGRSFLVHNKQQFEQQVMPR